MIEEMFVRHSLTDPTLLFDFSLFKKMICSQFLNKSVTLNTLFVSSCCHELAKKALSVRMLSMPYHIYSQLQKRLNRKNVLLVIFYAGWRDEINYAQMESGGSFMRNNNEENIFSSLFRRYFVVISSLFRRYPKGESLLYHQAKRIYIM